MALQIKKKYILDDAIDGDKIKLLKEQSIKGTDSTGQEVDLIKLDDNDKVIVNGEKVALDSELLAEKELREQGDSSLSSQISAIQGLDGVLFEDNANVYADAAAPKEDPIGRDGWYYKNDGTDIGISGDNKINWYFFDGTQQTETILSLTHGYFVGQFDGQSDEVILSAYTFPLGDGQDAGSWYRSRLNFVPGESFERGKKYIFVTDKENFPANIYPDLERVSLVPSESTTVGPMADNEQVMTMSLGTNSVAAVNSIEMLINNIGFTSETSGQNDTRLEIRGDFTLSGIKESISEEAAKRQSEDVRVLEESKVYTDSKVAALVDSAPEVLDTLKELSDALGGDENFATTVAGQIGAIDAKVTQEVSDREAADVSIQAALEQEIVDRETADLFIQNSVSSEAATRLSEDSRIEAKVDQEVAHRQSEVSRVEGLVSTEEAARIAADEALGLRIDNILSNTDASTLDSLSEIVTAFQTADGDLSAAITQALGTHTSELAVETAAREAADAQIRIDFEAADEAIDSRLASLESYEYKTDVMTLSPDDLSELVFPVQVVQDSMVLSVDRLMLVKNIDYTLVDGENGTKLTFIGSVAQGGEEELVEGQTLQAVYQYKTQM